MFSFQWLYSEYIINKDKVTGTDVDKSSRRIGTGTKVVTCVKEEHEFLFTVQELENNF